MQISIDDFDGDRKIYWEYIQKNHPDIAEFVMKVTKVFGKCEPPIIKTGEDMNHG